MANERFTLAESDSEIIEHRRISWAAVLAGMVIALVVQLVLSLLGVGVGAGTINPAEQQNPMEGLGTGAVIWLAITALAGLFAGGWVAGRLSGEANAADGSIHGLLTWGLTTIVAFYMVTTAVGNLIGGAVTMAGRVVASVSSGVGKVAPDIMESARARLGQMPGVDVGNIRQEMETLLRQTGKPELQPERLMSGQNEDIFMTLDRAFNSAGQAVNAADKQALVNILAARGVPQDQAQQSVDKWSSMYQQALNQYQALKQEARQAGEVAAAGLSRGALWTSFLLILSAAAAAFGGYLGIPRYGFEESGR